MKSKAIISLTVATVLTVTALVIPSNKVLALSKSVDQLYTEAYYASTRATIFKDQKSINEARKAIALLPKELDWAIGEFSKTVDQVQHPILVNIVSSIEKAQNELTQQNINKAKKAVNLDLPLEWRNSYSSAVDIIQNSLIQKAIETMKTAEISRLKADVDVAQSVLEDLNTAMSSDVVSWTSVAENEFQQKFGRINAGSYKVGQDIPAGEYILFSKSGGYLEVLKSSQSSFDNIITNEIIYGNSIITLKEGQYFNFKDAMMYPYEKAPLIKAENGKLGDGMYKVGVHIPAGEYKVYSTKENGYIAILKDSYNIFGSIIENDFFENNRYVTLKKGQYIKISDAYIDLNK